MAKYIEFRFTEGDTVTNLNSDAIISNFKKVECYHKNLQPAESYINLTIPYNQQIAQKLIQYSDSNVYCRLKDGNSVLFYGIINKSFKLSKTQTTQPIELEIRSPSFYLDKEIGENKVYESKTFKELLDALLILSGWYNAAHPITDYTTDTDLQSQLNKTIPVVVLKDTDKIKTIINQMVFELGAVYTWDTSGKFKIYPLFNESSNPHIFSDNNMYKTVEVSKKEEEADSITCIWNEKRFVENALIFSDTQGGTTTQLCKIEIQPNEYLFGKQTNYCNYDNTLGEVLWAKSITPTIEGISGSWNYTNEGTKMSLSYKNNTSSKQTITKLEVKGNAWIKIEGENRTKSINGKKNKDFNISFLNDDESISNLAKNLAQYYRYQDLSIRVYSYDDIPVGSFATVTTEGIGTITARVLQKTSYELKKCYEYQLEALKEFDTVVIETKRELQSSDYVNLQSQIIEVSQVVDELQENQLVMLFKRASQKPTEAGIVGNATLNFQTGALTFNAGANSNNWKQIQYLPAGTDPIYMTAAYAYGKGTVIITDNQWSTPVLYVKNGENGVNAAEVYSIIPDYNIVTRYKDGSLSSDSITFRFYKGNQSSRGAVSLYYELSARNSSGLWSEVASGTDSEVTFNFENETALKCDVYASENSDVPLDTETIMIVSEGQDAVSVVVSNPTAIVAVDSDGDVVDYDNTASSVYVLSGAEYLNYGNPDIPGEYSISVTYDNCASAGGGQPSYAGNLVDENNEAYYDENGDIYITSGSFDLPKLNQMDDESASRHITVSGTSIGGVKFEYVTSQNFVKVHYGKNGESVELLSVEYAVSETSSTTPSTWSTARPETVPQGDYLWTKKTYKNKETSETFAEYTYVYQAIDGERGLQGLQGPQGEQGIPGNNGISNYFHIKYSPVANPTDSQITETPSDYIGTYVDSNPTDSSSASKYTWARFKGIQGEQGDQGIPGTNGEDGNTSYLHIAYANSSDGKTGFSVSDSTGKTYIGQYVDFVIGDSTDPKDYKWSKIKGENGAPGNNGNDGTGAMAILLYKRAETLPALPQADFTITLGNPPVIIWGAGNNNGWSYYKPAATEDKLPLWQISATATFSGNQVQDTINKNEWHLDGIVQIDNGLTEDETSDLIDGKLDDFEKNMPEFSYSADAYFFNTNTNYVIEKNQAITVTVYCRRNGDLIDFEIVSIENDDSIKAIIDANKVHFIAEAGTVINEGKFVINVKVSEAKTTSLIVDENNEAYYDENNEPYGNVTYYDDAIASQRIEIPYRIAIGNRNRGKITEISAISGGSFNIGDYFTWCGASVNSKYSITGKFNQATVYRYNGEYWTEETDPIHLSATLSDVLSVSEEELERNNESLAKNNSWAYTWLDHLTVNDVFAKKVVSKLVESDLIISKESITNSLTIIDESIEVLGDDQVALINALSKDSSKTVIQGGKIKTNLIDAIELSAELIKSDSAIIDYLEGGDAEFNGHVKAQSLEIIKKITVGSNLKIDTDGSIEATNGKFSGDVELKTLSVEDSVSVGANFKLDKNGSIEATNGKFSGDVELKTLSVEDSVSVGTNFKLDKNGNIEATNGKFKGSIKTYKGLVFGYSNSWIDNMSYNNLFDLIKNTLIANDWTTGGNDIWYNASGSLILKIQYKKTTSIIYYLCIQFSSINITKSEGYITDITIDGSLDVLNSSGTSEGRVPNARVNLYKQPATTWTGSYIAVVERGYSGDISTTYYSLSNYNITISGYYRA